MLKKIKDELYWFRGWFRKIYIYPKMDIQKVNYDHYWKQKNGGEKGRISAWQIDRSEIIGEKLRGEENISVLDVGGGEGNILDYIRTKKGIKFSELYNADLSEYILRVSESYGIKSIKCDITDIKSVNLFPQIDYALMLEILEHIPNSEEFLLEVLKKVNKGIFFSIPNTGFIVYRLRLLFGSTPMQWQNHPAEHLRFWTVRDVKFWLDSLGFKGKYHLSFYRGIPFLNKIYPSMFAAGMVVEIRDEK